MNLTSHGFHPQRRHWGNRPRELVLAPGHDLLGRLQALGHRSPFGASCHGQPGNGVCFIFSGVLLGFLSTKIRSCRTALRQLLQ